MKQIGLVRSIDENIATVEIKRATACGENCAQCKGCSTSKSTVQVSNEINSKIGETVIIELSDSKILFAAFVVYIVPIILFIIGYAIFDIKIGILFFAVPFIILKILDKKIYKKYVGTVTKIIDRIK